MPENSSESLEGWATLVKTGYSKIISNTWPLELVKKFNLRNQLQVLKSYSRHLCELSKILDGPLGESQSFVNVTS
jgi:hypothetical protein